MDNMTFVDRLKRAVNTADSDELLRLCCDSSKRKEILDFKDDQGYCLFHLVAGSGTVDLMRTLIDVGAGVIEDYCNHEHILQTACCQGNTEVVKFLLQNDTNKNDETRVKYNNDKCLFYYAARSGNIETIKSLQNNGHLDINQIFPDGSSALLKLVKKNDCSGVETLCLCGADVNKGTINKSMNDPGYKAIHLVSEGIKNGAEMIQILLKYGANVNEPYIRSKLNQQPLFMAIKVGHEGNARVLLDHGADISYKGTSSKETIGCFCLAIKKCPSLVPDFIKGGANLYETHQQSSVLMIALDSDAGSEVIEALVKAGANTKFGKDGKTVIQCCTRYVQLKSFRNAGISVQNIESEHKVSTLGLALSSFICYSGSSNLEWLSEFIINDEISELVEHEVVDLISNGADPDMLTKEHDIPLIMAIEKRMKGVFNILIDAGANTSKLGKDGNSAIHLCCIEANWKFLEIMLEVDSDLNKTNSKGHFPLELAIQAGQDPNSYIFENNKTNVSKDLIKKMLDKGANPNLTPSGKNSPLILAILKGLDSIVDLLLEYGAVASQGENKSAALESCLQLKNGRNHYIKALIDNGLPLNEPNSSGHYPLEMLIYKRIDSSVFLLMLSNGANPNIVTKWGESILTLTVKSQLHDLCIALIEAGADVNKKDKDGVTAFDIFTRRYKEQSKYHRLQKQWNYSESPSADELFKKFVMAGIDVYQHNLSGTYPLLLAVSLGAEDIVTFILDKGEDVNIVDQSGETSLTKAISHGLEDIAKLLIHFGANVNQICKGSTRLHTENSSCCITFDDSISESVDGISYKSGDQFEMSILSKVITGIPLSLTKRRYFVNILLEHGADPNLEKSGVNSCLMHTVRYGDPVLVKTLLEASAETTHIGHNGYTVLHVFFATFHRSADKDNGSTILKMLLEYGAPANVLSNDGDQPVHKALSNCKTPDEFYNNHGDIMTIIDFTKDLNIPNKTRNTPFLAATKFCCLDVIKKMVEKGADVKSKGTNGNTALHIVMERTTFNKRDTDIISFLLSHGADINDVNDFEETPLVTFIKRGFVTTAHVSFLLKNGADPNVCADGINSALVEAISFPSFKVAKVLIDAKANVNHIGKNGNTVLHALFSKDSDTIVRRYSPYLYDSDDDSSDDDTTSSLDSSSNSCDDQVDDYTENKSIKQINYGRIETVGCPEKEVVDNKTNLEITAIDDTKTDDKLCMTSYQINENYYSTSSDIAAHWTQERTKKCKVLEATVRLVDAGAYMNILNKDGHSPVYYLVMNQDVTTIARVLPYLLEKGADPSLGADLPLIAAASLKQPGITKMLLKHGVDVDQKNSRGSAALSTVLSGYFEISKGSTREIVDILLNSAASVTLKDGNGKTPLFLLIYSIYNIIEQCSPYNAYEFQIQVAEIASDLIEKGADPNSTPFGEDSALHLAVECMLPNVVQILLESSANTDHTGKNGQNALHSCFGCEERSYSCYGDLYLLEILDALLAKKSNVNLKDNDGISPLQLAIRHQKTEAVEKLLFSNQNMQFEDSDKLEAFEMCLTIEPQVCLQILDVLSDHLNLAANNVDGFFRKFWKYIKTHNCSRNREVLDSVTYKILSTEEAVQVNLTSNAEYSPLMYFCHFGCCHAVKMLLSHNADVNYVGMRGTVLHELLDLTEGYADPLPHLIWKEADDDNAVLLFDCLLEEKPRMNIADNMDKTVAEKAIDILCGKRSATSSLGHQYYSPMNKHSFKNISLCFQKLLETGVTPDSNDLNDALLMCARKSDFKAMKCLIRHGADFYRKDINGKSILHLCWLDSLDGGLEFLRFFIESGHSLKRIDSVDNSILASLLTFGGKRGFVTNDKDISEIASLLIQNGACCEKDKEGNGPLHLAAKNGYLSTIGVLLKLDSVSIYDQNEEGDTVVHICLKHPKENICDVIEILLENKSAKLGLNLHNESVLYLAMVAGQTIRTNNVESVKYQLVKILLGYEADPNEHSRDHIPLFSALETGDVMTSKLLLNASSNINATNSRGKCGLHIIYENTRTKESDLSLTQLLLEHEINVNLVDESGQSALFSLVTGRGFTDSDVNSFQEILKVLLKHGADLNLCDKLEETVLSCLCSSGTNVEIGNILLKSGADPRKGCCLQNLLKSLRINGNKSCLLSLIFSLLQKGADPNRRRIEGSNIIDCVKNGNILLVEEFIKYGADVNGCDDIKNTALHYACNLGHSNDSYAMTTLLVKHGSNLNAASNCGKRPLDIVVENMIKEMTNVAVLSTAAKYCSTQTVDLSLLNVLVCGGADLRPVITDTIGPCYGISSLNTVHATPLNYPNRNKSTLYKLMSNGLFQTAEYLLRSGWDVKKEEWFDSFDVSKLDLTENIITNNRIYKRHDVEAKKAVFKSFLQNFDKSPKSLKTICRKQIRQQLLLVSNGSEIKTKISTLPLPEKIKSFLSLKECIQEKEII